MINHSKEKFVDTSLKLRKAFVDMICNEIDSVETVHQNAYVYKGEKYEFRVQSFAGGAYYALQRMATYESLYGFDGFAKKFFHNHCENIMNALAEEEE
jgi:hypothetical protein